MKKGRKEKTLSAWILKINGWKIKNHIQLPKKCVICIAPHTSNWDFLWGNLFQKSMKMKSHFFIKKEWFRFPFNLIMKPLGGIPVDRSRKTSLTDQIAEKFSQFDEFQIAITPEGTRKYNPDWKRGFYYIAQKANVPIILSYIDYKKKELGFGKQIFVTGKIEEELAEIKRFYKDITAKIPANFAC